MPNLQTNANGEGVAIFALPPTYGRWHLTVHAITRESAVGQQVFLIAD
ncbi:MAG: hypothetical protein IPL28_22845 [Chloroflexi bacterium]|nr:hypothetical protein [Chloroflexota bacterium]